MSGLGGAVAAISLPGTWADETSGPVKQGRSSEDYTLAAYYFGNYHVDPRNEAQHGHGWTEWRLVEAARPRFAGHAQPKIPFMGIRG